MPLLQFCGFATVVSFETMVGKKADYAVFNTALHAAKTARHLVVYEMRRNLNSDASNLNFMARSFHEMPCSFSAMRISFFRHQIGC